MRVSITGERGPNDAQVDAIRAASPDARRPPLADVVAALAGVQELVLGIPEPAAEALALLERTGLRHERVVLRDLRGVGLWAALGFEPLQDGEHRWTFRPWSRPEIVVSAVRIGSTWDVEARRARGRFSEERDWPGLHTQRVLVRGEGRGGRGPLVPPRPRRPRPEIDVARAKASPEASAEADEMLRRMHTAPPPRRHIVLDGNAADLYWMTDGVQRQVRTHEPMRDDVRGTSLLLAGIAVATAITASPTAPSEIREALLDLGTWAQDRP